MLDLFAGSQIRLRRTAAKQVDQSQVTDRVVKFDQMFDPKHSLIQLLNHLNVVAQSAHTVDVGNTALVKDGDRSAYITKPTPRNETLFEEFEIG